MHKRVYFTASPLGALLSLLTSFLYLPLLEHATHLWAFTGLSLLIFAHVSVLYFLASATQKIPWGEFWRGAIIGINAGLNGLALYCIFGGISLPIAVGLIVFAGSSLYVSRHKLYHSLLGWLNWLLPMSWLVSGVGAIFYMLSVVASPLALFFPSLSGLRIRVGLELRTCTLVIYGGLIKPFTGFTGFNMGNFVFIKPGGEYLLLHEIGHLLSLSVMGFAFHYIGGIDEGYLKRNYWEAYAEYIADSYNHPTEAATSMWR